MLTRFIDGYFRLLKALIAVCLTCMVVLVLSNVILRYAFNSGITLSEEVSRWLFVYLVFLGAIVALRERGHLGMDSLVSRLSPLGKRVCLIISLLLMLWATGLLIQGSWTQTLINMGTHAPASGLPVAVVYATGLFYGVSAGLILLWDLWRALTGQMTEDELVMVRESEELDPTASVPVESPTLRSAP
jgi:TRAP-type C4-dicarboxylate transport system permease small subunit